MLPRVSQHLTQISFSPSTFSGFLPLSDSSDVFNVKFVKSSPPLWVLPHACTHTHAHTPTSPSLLPLLTFLSHPFSNLKLGWKWLQECVEQRQDEETA